MISLHVEEKKESSYKTIIFALCMGFCDTFSGAAIPTLFLIYTDVWWTFLLFGITTVTVIIDKYEWLALTPLGVLDAIAIIFVTTVMAQVYNSRYMRNFRYLTYLCVVSGIIITSKGNFPSQQAASFAWSSFITCALAFGGEQLSTLFLLRFWDTLEGPFIKNSSLLVK